MRRAARANAPYVCPSCLLTASRGLRTRQIACAGSSPNNVLGLSVTSPSSSSGAARFTTSAAASARRRPSGSGNPPQARLVESTKSIRRVRASGFVTDAQADSTTVILDEKQRGQLQAALRVQKRLEIGIHSVKKPAPDALRGMTISEVLKTVPVIDSPPDEARILGTIQQVYADKAYSIFTDEITLAVRHRNEAQREVKDDETKQILDRLGLLGKKSEVSGEQPATSEGLASGEVSEEPVAQTAKRIRPSLLNVFEKTAEKPQKSSRPAVPKSAAKLEKPPPFPTKPKAIKIKASDLKLKPVEVESPPQIPRLSFDLSRVLFNPGVYHLQDPRSRVYNFDPYLEQPMPISEFNFDALNAYVTSSEDQDLLSLARDLDKRYIGSSSSMSAGLCQFHYLLSNWRDLNTGHITRGFSDVRQDYTVIMRSPAAIFLRYRDGVYAVDADKEYDTPNVLMSLGKSLEKLLTLEKDEIEKWRRKHTSEDESFSDSQDEAFHYSEQGSFLLRSQLDAYDPRLPGTGVFDLKTRAVAGIRMNMREHEEGMGYQIRERFGTWESYEREYYDMMRSTMLKYSMQVRMGKMDGIFVAYHNIGRIFGFQYIPLTEMDFAIHGQSDPALGDQEFKLSIDLMRMIFDKVTAKYPEQSIRFHFDTREPTTNDPKPYMHIFAEPMTNQEIDEVQRRHNEEFDAFEKRIFSGQDPDAPVSAESADTGIAKTNTTMEENGQTLRAAMTSDQTKAATSTAADTTFLDMIMKAVPADEQPKELKPVLGFKLSVTNMLNDYPVTRPDKVTPTSQWTINYVLEQMSDETARKQYIFCKNRRMAALSVSKRQSGGFIKSIRELSLQGAEWRRQQDEVDAQRDTVVLYQDRIKV